MDRKNAHGTESPRRTEVASSGNQTEMVQTFFALDEDFCCVGRVCGTCGERGDCTREARNSQGSCEDWCSRLEATRRRNEK